MSMKSKAPLYVRKLAILAMVLAASFSLVPVTFAMPPDDPKAFTAEQIVETVIAFAGGGMGRAVLDQIRRNGVERGRLTRTAADGRAEEVRYELRFVRGEKPDNYKVRLDSKSPQAEYSLIYGN